MNYKNAQYSYGSKTYETNLDVSENQNNKNLFLKYLQKVKGNCVQRSGIQEVARLISTNSTVIYNISNNTINQL